MSIEALKLTRDVTFGLLSICFCLFMLSFITPYWFHKNRELTQLRVFHGLWRLCDLSLEACFQIVGSNLNRSWMKWTQAIMILDLFAYSAALGFYCHWMSKPRSYLEKFGLGWAGSTATGCCILAGVLNLIGVSIFGYHYMDRDDYDDPYGWSFVMACVIGVLTFVLGVTGLAVAAFFGKKGSRRPPQDATAAY